MRTHDYWNSLIAKSASRFFLLASLAHKPMHGYKLAKAIAGGCGNCCTPTDAMIYPAIRELSEAGLIVCEPEHHGGRKRNVCHLTEAGHQAYRTAAESWGRVLPYLSTAVQKGLAPSERPSKGDENDQAISGDDQNCCS